LEPSITRFSGKSWHNFSTTTAIDLSISHSHRTIFNWFSERFLSACHSLRSARPKTYVTAACYADGFHEAFPCSPLRILPIVSALFRFAAEPFFLGFPQAVPPECFLTWWKKPLHGCSSSCQNRRELE